MQNSGSQLSQAELGGNTKTPSTKPASKNQLYLWMITLPADETDASQLSQELKIFSKKFTFQKEKGEETGYVHWQIFISLKTKEYFDTVKNLFPSKAHIEPVKNGWAAAKYCSKSDTRIEGPYTEESTFLETITTLYKWQQNVLDECLKKPNDRTIVWIWDKEGNKGKTAFCKYMAIKHKATILGNGAFKDVAYAVGENPKIVFFNITRDLEERFNYSVVEAVKDGLLFSGKYESTTKIFNSPHVYIFANFEPRKDAMSLDRWDIREIGQESFLPSSLTAPRSSLTAPRPLTAGVKGSLF